MTVWRDAHGVVYDTARDYYEPPPELGLIPFIIRAEDNRDVVTQVNSGYAHGGGWHSFGAGKWKLNRDNMHLTYPGDPTYIPEAWAVISPRETVYVYESGWVMIYRYPDDFDVARMD